MCGRARRTSPWGACRPRPTGLARHACDRLHPGWRRSRKRVRSRAKTDKRAGQRLAGRETCELPGCLTGRRRMRNVFSCRSERTAGFRPAGRTDQADRDSTESHLVVYGGIPRSDFTDRTPQANETGRTGQTPREQGPGTGRSPVCGCCLISQQCVLVFDAIWSWPLFFWGLWLVFLVDAASFLGVVFAGVFSLGIVVCWLGFWLVGLQFFWRV